MVPLGVIRVLVMLAGDTADDEETLSALDRALHASLGSDAVVSVDHVRSVDDGALAEHAKSRAATLLCVIAWSDGQRRATLHFYRPDDGRWSDREIGFDASDVGAERGRTLGFAMASMVPDEAFRRPQTDAVSVGQAPSPSSAAQTAPTVDKPSRGVGPRSTSGRYAVEVVGNATAALGGSGGGVGGGVAARLVLSPTIALRAGVGARVAELHAAQATSRNYAGSVGIAWSVPLTSAGSVRVGARLDACVFAQQVVHLSSDDPAPDGRLRVLPAAAVAAEGAWQFVDQAAVVAAFGPEVAFGATDIVVRGREVADLVPVRLFGEAGLRVMF